MKRRLALFLTVISAGAGLAILPAAAQAKPLCAASLTFYHDPARILQKLYAHAVWSCQGERVTTKMNLVTYIQEDVSGTWTDAHEPIIVRPIEKLPNLVHRQHALWEVNCAAGQWYRAVMLADAYNDTEGLVGAVVLVTREIKCPTILSGVPIIVAWQSTPTSETIEKPAAESAYEAALEVNRACSEEEYVTEVRPIEAETPLGTNLYTPEEYPYYVCSPTTEHLHVCPQE
jgi:hypothetical protein